MSKKMSSGDGMTVPTVSIEESTPHSSPIPGLSPTHTPPNELADTPDAATNNNDDSSNKPAGGEIAIAAGNDFTPEQVKEINRRANGRGPTQFDGAYMKEEHEPLIVEMRQAVSEYEGYNEELHTDLYLYKFLKARNYKVDIAAGLFKTMLEYRKNDKVDSIIKDYTPTQVCLKFLTNGYHGVSKTGHLIWYV